MTTPTDFNFPSLHFPREQYLPAGAPRPPIPPHDHSRRNLRNEMCRSMIELGGCIYGEKCDFAHRAEELEAPSQEKPSAYRTKLCRNFFVEGVCYYGTRCRFSHDVSYASRLGWVYDPSISAYVNDGKVLGYPKSKIDSKVDECWAARKPEFSPALEPVALLRDVRPRWQR